MGVAIPCGIPSSLNSLRLPGASYTRTPTATLLPTRFHDASKGPICLPTKVIACIKRPKAACQVGCSFEGFTGMPVGVSTRCNVEGAWCAGVVVLGCGPQVCAGLLGGEGMCKALEGKLLTSITTGVKIAALDQVVPGTTRVVRAMPNTGGGYIREIVSVIAMGGHIPTAKKYLVSCIPVLSQIGCSLVLG
ncbi:unnamed protein product [Tuber aestivum]|uniref:Uncharacterized protein n=1 Tax=Tuber aestivum TaxID=59557 RepID=A0A292Q5K2_9PEZI|nr:unnamed protein product [Tuber aestivum]